jgi:hypothetical protein
MQARSALKSVARDVTQSFTSLLSFWGDDYVMGHIIAAAWSTGGTRLRIDLLTGQADPSPLFIPKVKECISGFVRHFPSLLEHSRSHVSMVASAELSITVDPTIRRPYGDTGLAESPYKCATRIIDDSGGVHEYAVNGWWYPAESSSLEVPLWRVRRQSKKP